MVGMDCGRTLSVQGLYVYKDLDFTAGLYALYTIIAIFGYFKWKRMMERAVE